MGDIGRARTARARAAGLVVGARSVLRAAEHQPIRVVLVAADAPGPTTEPVRRLAHDRGWPVEVFGSAAELGRWCGVDRPVAVAAHLAPSARPAAEPGR